jgi:hypothetical protein
MDTEQSTPMGPEAVGDETFAVFGMYRLFAVGDSNLGIQRGSRLYVGITMRPFTERWQEEADRPPTSLWWPLVDHSLTETVLLNGGKPMFKWQAAKIEAKAIGEYDEVRDRYGTLANHHHNGNAGAELISLIQAIYGPDGMGGHSPVYVGDPPLATALQAVSEAVPFLVAAAAVVAGLAAAIPVLL